MEVIFALIAGMALIDGFIERQFFGITVLYIGMLLLFLSYVYEITCRTRLKIKLQGYETIWLTLIVYGLVVTLGSFVEELKPFVSEKVLINSGYVFRQAYYIFFFPAVILVTDSKSKRFCYTIIKKYNRLLFLIIAVVNTLKNMDPATSVVTTFLLAFLSLMSSRKNVVDILMAVFILFSPVAVGGEMTNVLIRFVYAAIFLFGKKRTGLLKLMMLGIWCCVGICFVIPFLLETSGDLVDANTAWRARFWEDEIKILADSLFTGVGYGTSYTSTDFVNPSTYVLTHAGEPFAPTAQYSTYDKVFVTGPHNSFVSLTFRLGLIGLLLFSTFLIVLQKKQISCMKGVSLASIFAICSSLIIITLNVGLESPTYLLLFIFSACIANYELKNGSG
ncbi:MAG: hypothetical protein J6J12_02550 [Oscillospiraceae bacterium]|nr:hypothetical protein [Oscillospiraceae bacterium]